MILINEYSSDIILIESNESIWQRLKKFFIKIFRIIKNSIKKFFNWIKSLFKSKDKDKYKEDDNDLLDEYENLPKGVKQLLERRYNENYNGISYNVLELITKIDDICIKYLKNTSSIIYTKYKSYSSDENSYESPDDILDVKKVEHECYDIYNNMKKKDISFTEFISILPQAIEKFNNIDKELRTIYCYTECYERCNTYINELSDTNNKHNDAKLVNLLEVLLVRIKQTFDFEIRFLGRIGYLVKSIYNKITEAINKNKKKNLGEKNDID